jgi:hypothetical protein
MFDFDCLVLLLQDIISDIKKFGVGGFGASSTYFARFPCHSQPETQGEGTCE